MIPIKIRVTQVHFAKRPNRSETEEFDAEWTPGAGADQFAAVASGIAVWLRASPFKLDNTYVVIKIYNATVPDYRRRKRGLLWASDWHKNYRMSPAANAARALANKSSVESATHLASIHAAGRVKAGTMTASEEAAMFAVFDDMKSESGEFFAKAVAELASCFYDNIRL